MYRIILFTILFACLFYPYYTSGQDSYYIKILKERQNKDSLFFNPSKTPLKPNDLKKFTGLKYYPVDSSYVVQAKLVPYKKKKKQQFNTSSGNIREYTIYGYLVFILKGIKIKINVFQTTNVEQLKKDPHRLFLPFTDNTNGEETYGGGRYIDFEITQDNIVMIDFNLAYNPYCAYTTGYSCAIPPKENHINIEIKAGEKKYKDH